MNWQTLFITLLLELVLGFYWWRRAALQVHAKATLTLRPETRHYTRTREAKRKPSAHLTNTHVGSVSSARGS
jgi:hypothetical protein